MRYEELNWFDIENYLRDDDRLIIVLGACEQHGYLSILTDVKIPMALADAASQKTGVLVAPAVNFGCSPYFLAYPGTLSLRQITLLQLVEDLLTSSIQQGFKRFLLLNGHGGNEPARSILYEIANQHAGLSIAWYSWWQSHSVNAVAQKYELKSTHGGWIEAFPFTSVSELPSGEKLPPRVPGIINADQARKIYGDGVFGGPYQVEHSIMEEIFNAALDDILQLLKFE
jgi:creatinine amidohydrolase